MIGWAVFTLHILDLILECQVLPNQEGGLPLFVSEPSCGRGRSRSGLSPD